jgi:putative SOS response-associated peptidase YedK
MCGRFTLRATAKIVAPAFNLWQAPDLHPRYNIAPGQRVPVVRCSETGERELVFLRWGLIPAWADNPSIGDHLANARSETVSIKPSFRDAFRSRRCLVLADGFYEWQRTGGRKQPYFVRLKSDQPFGMAGLWELWERQGEAIESCTILTSNANELMERIHERMPVIITPDKYDLWLDPNCQDEEKLRALLRRYRSEEMVAYPVSTIVNDPRNDVPKCIEPVR